MRRNISMDHSLVQEAGQTGHCFDVTSRRDLAIIGALVLVLMKTTRVLLFALIAALWISIQFAGAASETTHVDVLRPGTCMPGAKLYYAKNEDEEDDIMADVLAGKSRKPDAVVERFDVATQTVYFKRGNGKSPHVSRVYHWTKVGIRGVKLRAVRLPSREAETSTLVFSGL